MNYMKNQDQQEERLILNKLKQSELISSSVQHSGELPTVCPLE